MYTSTDCWLSGILNEDRSHEVRIVAYFLGFVLLNYLSVLFSKAYGHPLNLRPTIVGSTFHAVVTGTSSVVVVTLGPEYYPIWQTILVPFSLGYFLADICLYCIPKRDFLITIHHITMLTCHFPVGEDVLAFMCSGGQKEFIIWLSMCGYTSEIVIPILSFRWWQTQVLKEHCRSFAITGGMIIICFVIRCVTMLFLTKKVIDNYDNFIAYEQYLPLGVCVVGHVTICLMSLYWLFVILRNGVPRYLTFTEPPKSKFSFGASLAADSKETGEQRKKKD